MKELTFKACDMHVHFRQGDMLTKVAPLTAQHFARALLMPNTTPPIRTAADARRYKREVMDACSQYKGFEPLMTFKILPDTTPEMVRDFLPSLGQIPIAVAGKVYPKGLTTNAQDGVEDYFELFPVFEVMQELGLILCLHGEKPGKYIEGLDRERAFLGTLKFIVATFPDLKIVMEHITTDAAVNTVLDMPSNVAATITVHHLLLTYDEVGVDKMRPHNYCKPVAKRAADRDALVEAAISGCPKFMFGSDSAPHPQHKKECSECCAGVFTAPIALPLLAEIFEQHNALDRLANFAGRFAWRFYEILEFLDKPAKQVTLVKEPMVVPEKYGDVVPFKSGETISWNVKN